MTAMAVFAAETSYNGFLPIGVDINALTGAASSGYTPFDNHVAGTLSLPKWDPVAVAGDASAILTDVCYELNYFIWNDYTVTLGTGTAVTGSGIVTINGPGGTSLPDLFIYNIPAGNAPASGTVIFFNEDPLKLFPSEALFTGAGTADFTLQAVGNFGITGSGEAGGTVIPYLAAEVILTYKWTTPEIPEPSTWAAIGFVGAIGGWTFLRSRKSKKA